MIDHLKCNFHFLYLSKNLFLNSKESDVITQVLNLILKMMLDYCSSLNLMVLESQLMLSSPQSLEASANLSTESSNHLAPGQLIIN